MKHLKLFGVILVASVAFVACDDTFLDKTVTTDLDEEVVFSDSAYTAGFLTDIYSAAGFDVYYKRWENGGLQVACDEAEFRQISNISTGASFATGTVNPVTVSKDTWETCYKKIRACNQFLKNADNSPMIESKKTQYKTEARFLRAWYYFILLRHYGGVPLIGDVVYSDNDEMKSTRDTYEACSEYILSECRAILNSNVLRARTSGINQGRISEGAVRGLISRLTLMNASPLFNGSDFGTPETAELLHFPTYDANRWREAYQAAKDVMTMQGNYALYEKHENDEKNWNLEAVREEPGWGFYVVNGVCSDFYTNHTDWGDLHFSFGGYQEHLFTNRKDRGYEPQQTLNPKSVGGNGNGGYVYAGLANAFPMADGKAIDDASGKYTYDPFHPAANRDPRFMNTVIYNGKQVSTGWLGVTTCYTRTGESGTTDDEVRKGTPTGYYTCKFIHRLAAANSVLGTPSYPALIRYAEILLNYAEAANEYFGPEFEDDIEINEYNQQGMLLKDAGGEQVTMKMSPYTALKLLRRRAGIERGEDGMYGLKAGMSKEEMREAIRLERRIELAYEGFRFFDVRRWMIVEQTDNGPMMGTEVVYDPAAKKETAVNQFVVRNHVFRPAMYFFPIPYDEIVKQPELRQNPYYENSAE